MQLGHAVHARPVGNQISLLRGNPYQLSGCGLPDQSCQPIREAGDRFAAQQQYQPMARGG